MFGDYLLPNMDPGNAYQIIATMAYTKVKYLIEQTVASGLIYLNSHARDFALFAQPAWHQLDQLPIHDCLFQS